MTTTTIDTLAATIVKAAEAARDARVENEDNCGDWSDMAKHRAYVAVLASVSFWVSSSRTVMASVADTREGRIWSGVASELLDIATTDIDLGNGAIIEKLSPTVHGLYW